MNHAHQPAVWVLRRIAASNEFEGIRCLNPFHYPSTGQGILSRRLMIDSPLFKRPPRFNNTRKAFITVILCLASDHHVVQCIKNHVMF